MATRVVNRASGERYDVNVAAPSMYANPFVIGIHGTRHEVVAMYERHARSSLALLAAIKKLRGLTLGCHCTPLECHADVIARIADEQ